MNIIEMEEILNRLSDTIKKLQNNKIGFRFCFFQTSMLTLIVQYNNFGKNIHIRYK